MNELFPRRRETARERIARIRHERDPGPFIDVGMIAGRSTAGRTRVEDYAVDLHPAPPNWLDSFKHTLKWMLPL